MSPSVSVSASPSVSPSASPSASPSGAVGDEDTYYICNTSGGGDDTLDLYVDGVLIKSSTVDAIDYQDTDLTTTGNIYGRGTANVIVIPTSDPGVAGAIWNNAGTLSISAG